MWHSFQAVAAWLLALSSLGIVAGANVRAAETMLSLGFSGGHETDSRDGGRPVVLVAAALGVKPEAFREAFSGVTPARNGRPSPDEARRNKSVLMKALQPLGVTNDRLDEVSDYYRYQPQRGELWKTIPAKGHAIVEGGKIARVVLTEPGAGYSSPPKVTVQGMEQFKLKATLRFDKDLKKNGSIASIELAVPGRE